MYGCNIFDDFYIMTDVFKRVLAGPRIKTSDCITGLYKLCLHNYTINTKFSSNVVPAPRTVQSYSNNICTLDVTAFF